MLQVLNCRLINMYGLTKFKNSTVTGIIGKNKEILNTLWSIFAFLYSRLRHIRETASRSKNTC